MASAVLKARKRELCPICGNWITFSQKIMKDYTTRQWAHSVCVIERMNKPANTTP